MRESTWKEEDCAGTDGWRSRAAGFMWLVSKSGLQGAIWLTGRDLKSVKIDLCVLRSKTNKCYRWPTTDRKKSSSSPFSWTKTLQPSSWAEKLAHANDGNRACTRPAAKEVVFLDRVSDKVLVDFGLLISVYLSLLHLCFRGSTVSPL